MDDRNILLVEDEQKIADTLKLGLEEHGYAVEVAYDGTAGYQFFREKPFDLIVLDLNLPGLNGMELCKRVRKEKKEMPVIMLTALSTLNDKIEGYDAGADDYMIKPFEFQELLLRIRALLRRATVTNGLSGNLLAAGDLQMDLDSKEVKRGEKLISLTAKEFQLLEYLLRNKNKTVSRAEIAIHVWDIDFDTNTNVIDVYINYVRNKIDKPFDKKLIHTITGFGYVLKLPGS